MASARLASAVTRVLGSPVVERVGAATTARRLRVLAYHGIPDPSAFARQLDHLLDLYHPVSGSQVIAALGGRVALPTRAVWVTFDDGRPEVLDDGLPLLQARGIPATMYVCPGVLDTDDPYWWDVVAAAETRGVGPTSWVPPSTMSMTAALKQVPDARRRAIVEELAARLYDAGVDVRTRQLRTDELRRWADAGMEVGNHTWDHPLLDRCDEEEQKRQIEQAHEAITARVGAPVTFAYPNGHVTTAARECIRRLGYGSGVDFAHRLCTRGSDPLALPRLRIDSDAPLPRFRAIVSGAHSAVFALRRGWAN